MIKLDIMRNRAGVVSYALSKTKQNMQKQILEGIKSLPVTETQVLSLRINDHPVGRFFSKMFDMGEEIVKADLKAEFTRAHFENGKLSAQKYNFTDTFTAQELTDLKEGKDLLCNKKSFIYKLVQKINKAIEE